jgi:hypothetical protein
MSNTYSTVLHTSGQKGMATSTKRSLQGWGGGGLHVKCVQCFQYAHNYDVYQRPDF